jgi:hypothetical protein
LRSGSRRWVPFGHGFSAEARGDQRSVGLLRDVRGCHHPDSDLEKKTKLSFGELKEHDHFAEGGDPGTPEAPTGQDGETQTIKLIYRPGDIVV